MKKVILNLMVTAAAGMLVTASAQPVPEQNNGDTNNVPVPEQQPGTAAPDAGGPPAVPPDANGNAEQAQPMPEEQAPAAASQNGDEQSSVITPSRSQHNAQDYGSNFMPPTGMGTNSDAIILNFNNAPLEMVLNYLSDAAGFIIVLDTHVNGNVSIIAKHPVTTQEAVDLLNGQFNKNGYAAIREGRTLTIVDKNDAKTASIPVKTGNDPDQIPKNAEIVTQIIPVRFVEARQLVSDLTSFVSPQATVVANDAGNSIVITDTQENIRHLVEIIKAIDSSAEAETEIRVFQLKNASPVDVANELSSVFPSGTSASGGSAAPIRFGGGPFGGFGGGFGRFFGGGGGGGGFGGGGGAGGNNSQNDRIKKETQVTAVADARTSSVIVTAPKDLMEEIAQMMTQLDVQSDRDQGVYVFKMNNGDPQAVVTELQSMFQSSSSRNQTGQSQNSALQQRQINDTTSQGSTSSSSSGFGGSSGGIGGGGGRTGGAF